LIASFTKSIVCVYYQYNLDYIKKELCVNKDKPKMNCNGKCYLAKQIKKTEPVPVEIPQSVKDFKEVLFITNNLNNTFGDFQIASFSFTLFSVKLKSLYEAKIFTPPKIL
jgi:hypothetical protein